MSNHFALNGLRSYEADGSAYLNEEFVKGVVCLNKAELVTIPMRYNIYEDQVEFNQSETYFAMDPKLDIDSIKFGDHTLVVRDLNGHNKLDFLLLLQRGSAKLLLRKVIKFKPAEEPSAMKYEGTRAKFSPAPDQFYIEVEGRLIEVDNIKKLIAQFPKNQDKLNLLVKDEKLSAKKEEDLIRLVKYYNSLN